MLVTSLIRLLCNSNYCLSIYQHFHDPVLDLTYMNFRLWCWATLRKKRVGRGAKESLRDESLANPLFMRRSYSASYLQIRKNASDDLLLFSQKRKKAFCTVHETSWRPLSNCTKMIRHESHFISLLHVGIYYSATSSLQLWKLIVISLEVTFKLMLLKGFFNWSKFISS